MTPGARVAAAADILDAIRDGQAAEQALTTWARGSRFAGSKDRAAVRDHVYDALRARRSLGDGSGRALMINLAKRDGRDVAALFTGEGHAPAALDDAERAALSSAMRLLDAQSCDIPDWLWPIWQQSLGDDARLAARVQQHRADVFLRVNGRRTSTADAISALAEDQITVQQHPEIVGCLRVLTNPRRVKLAAAYLDGRVELQDASSQFAISKLRVPAGGRVLDYCAGGGGKALGIADQFDAQVFAHDIAPQRMADLSTRAARAGVDVPQIATDDLVRTAPFDLVFCDAPCSGSGTWRRTPDAKWRLTQARLDSLQGMQADVIAAGAKLVRPGGVLAYATCSVLAVENDAIVDAFCARHPTWQRRARHQLLPGENGDGFYLCLLENT
ncbi:RsmB/NOP family class I SAM-dependent RNA methyltransferase [Loktanella sp. D2R18]|uniref:RsmB/NOP family class I SAM-dependent RNA methyltransferase n=1 Tax=Rhodobacterales TaxID=204455 RepID=UPI000DE92351|nr:MULTISPECIES: RsmB/NOP family class I SAM-dependent RNA methyltransferase [Rhodobacterales]MDO6590699.1 RsmB/NOP family class I SAM-dependent RNA methyltransferase [Yoonia sp. 1_MG-2023]RBW44679.1 RsmB/NOP family class I SAM-dependent RNA methyltransferase [Loktanella sp. D2R18]